MRGHFFNITYNCLQPTLYKLLCMQANNKIHRFRQIFFHPRVFSFILTGTCIIFLTFLTNNNALEIAISGIASVFIGIGVNNFSSIETSHADLQKQKNKEQHLTSILELIELKSKRIQTDACSSGNDILVQEAKELEKLTAITIQLLNNHEDINI